MKFHTIGHLALATRHVTALDILEAAGFDLTKKIYSDEGPAASTHYQAEDKDEDRSLRLRFRRRPRDVVFLQRQKAEVGGGYR